MSSPHDTLSDMQRHITALQAENESLLNRNTELAEGLILFETEHKHNQKILFALLALFVIALCIVYMQHKSIVQYKKDIVMVVSDVANRQQQINDINETMQGYKDANEQLIKFCRPCDVNSAINHTDLPKIKRG